MNKYINESLKNENLINEIVIQNVSLVKKIAYHLANKLPPNIQIEDLIQSGMIGLMEAAKNFNDEKGASFSTYAGIRIKGSMLDEIRKSDWAPRSVHKNSRTIADAVNCLENIVYRNARDIEIANKLQVTLEEYHRMMQDTIGTKIFGFEELGFNEYYVPISSTGSTDKTIDPSEILQQENYRQKIKLGISKLSKKEKMVIILYYNKELNLKEIGAILDVSESRVSQIHSQAVAMLKSTVVDLKINI